MAMSRLPGLDPVRAGPIDRFVLLVPWVAIAVPAVVWSAGVVIPERYRWAPLVASAVLFGLPHGAVDHLAIPRVRDERPGIRWFAIVSGLYLVLGTGYAVAWILAPAVAVVGFILLTWVHWGQGDLHPLVAVLGGDHLDAGGQRVLAVAVRGGLPMVVPLLAFPDRYREVVGLLLGLFDTPVTAVSWWFLPRVRLALGVGFGAVVLTSLTLGFARSRGSHEAWLIDAGEVALLWWYFWTVPPVLAVGVYFALWHSVRHVGRLMALDGREGFAASLRRFARDATPLSIGALLLGGGLALLVPETPTGLSGLVALYLVLIALLTLPHAVVVSWMDREQGLW